jgi:TetR/AcrR family transcriptional regulator, mexJK operon transcriptional repressor
MKSAEPCQTCQSIPKRGRPRDPALLERILAAGQRQFIGQGFVATSVESIAQEAGVSKMTIYKYFSTKEALFEHCIATRTDLVFSHQAAISSAAETPERVKTVLTELATEFVRLMRDPEVMAMQRTFIANASQHPHVCQTFFEQGCERLTRQVSQYLAHVHDEGLLQVPNPLRAASQFLGMCLGRAHLRGLLALGTPTLDEDHAMIHDNVAMFLRAYAASTLQAKP